MMWGELLDRTLVAFPMDESGIMSNVAKSYLIEAQEDLILHTRCLEKAYSQTITAASSGVALPDDFIEMTGRVEWKGEKIEPVNEWQYQSMKKSDDSWVMGTPTGYFIHGNYLYLVPGAASSGKLTMWCTYRPVVQDESQMASVDFMWDTIQNEEPDIPKVYHKYLVDFARSKLLEDKGEHSASDRYYNKYMMNRTKLKALHANRESSGPSQVVNVL